MTGQSRDNVFAVILAGGSGTRFWPRSRELKPKQLCKIGGYQKTMIEITLDRLTGFIPKERRMIVTHTKQKPQTQDIVAKECSWLIAEPKANNTAAALLIAALEIAEKTPDALMVSLHADHVINNTAQFIKKISEALTIAQEGYLTLLGIQPTAPETGYGYIERGSVLKNSAAGFLVKNFKEKPNEATAKEYIKSGNFLWNSGIFVWPVKTLIEEFEHYLPTSVAALQKARAAVGKPFSQMSAQELLPFYEQVDKISIDNGILEKSKRVAVLSCDFDWLDIGSWAALEETFPVDAQGNLGFGDVLLIDSKNVTADTDGPLIATVGVENLVVVVSGGTVLVCPKDRAQDVKLVVERLKAMKRDELV